MTVLSVRERDRPPLEAVKLLASAPAVDLFMWLVYRCFVAKREERIPLFVTFGLTAQLGSAEYTRGRGASVPCFSNGYRRSTWPGRSALPESVLTAVTSP